MRRAVFKFADGDHANVAAEYIDIQKEMVIAWNNNEIVAIAQLSAINAAWISEKKDVENES